jgi:hypothetical protein
MKNYKYEKKINEDFSFLKKIEEQEQELINKITTKSFFNLEKENKYYFVKNLFVNYVNINKFIYNIRFNRINLINKIKLYYNELINKKIQTKNLKKLFFPIQTYLKNNKKIFIYTYFSKLYILYFF